jgi:hypothetical protein
MTTTLTEAATRFVGGEHRMLIGGERVPTSGGEWPEVTDPATGRVFATVPAGPRQQDSLDRPVLSPKSKGEEAQ